MNVPFIAILIAFDAYFNIGRTGISFGEVFYIAFQTAIFHLVFKGAYILFRSMKFKFETRLEQQQNNKKNPILYFLFIAPFEKYEVVDIKMMKRYYINIPILIFVVLLLIYTNIYHYEHIYFKVFVVLLFIYTATRAYKVFWILTMFIFGVIFISNGFECNRCIWTFVLSIIGAVTFAIPNNLIRRFSWMKD